MARDNLWRAPRIHKELVRLGFEISQRTVARYVSRLPTTPAARQSWRTFLRNHRDAIAAMDLFVVPTITFRLVYGFFVIHHDRRRVLHANVTEHPTAAWVTQQLREAFPWEATAKYLVFDRDSIFNPTVKGAIESMGLEIKQTAFRSPWQNGVAERWIGCLRQSLLHHVIVLNEDHLRRLVRDYVGYHNAERLHCALDGDAPDGRAIEQRPSATAKVVSHARLGGLHHRYEWREAA
jgi:transposase InsO family protein